MEDLMGRNFKETAQLNTDLDKYTKNYEKIFKNPKPRTKSRVKKQKPLVIKDKLTINKTALFDALCTAFTPTQAKHRIDGMWETLNRMPKK